MELQDAVQHLHAGVGAGMASAHALFIAAERGDSPNLPSSQ